TAAGRRQLVVPTGQSILGLDPVKGTGLWRYPFGNQFNATCATPVWTGDALFVSAAYGAGCAALEIVPQGDGLTVREKWRSRKNLQTLMATGMVVDGHVYGCHGDISAILLRILDLRTGEIPWGERPAGTGAPGGGVGAGGGRTPAVPARARHAAAAGGQPEALHGQGGVAEADDVQVVGDACVRGRAAVPAR